MSKPVHEVTVTLSDIAEEWRLARAGDRKRLTGYPITLSGGLGGWGGAELTDVDRWVAEGYFEGEPLSMPDAAAEMIVPQLEWQEDEGDLIYSAAVAGDDLYKVAWEPTEAPRGLSIKARLYISANVDAGDVNRYAEWLLSVIDGVERMGETPDVYLYTGADSTDGYEVRVQIPLRKAGEQIDAATWRALLAPGGYRTLVFLAEYIAATRVGKTLQSGLGCDSIRATAKRWTITCDDDVLDIAPPMSLRPLDTASLTKQVAEVIA